MENLVWIMYLQGALERTVDLLAGVTALFIIIYVIACICCAVTYGDEEHDTVTEVRKSLHSYFWIVFLYMSLKAINPSSDQFLKLVAVYGGVSILENPEIQKTGGKALEAVNKALDAYLTEEEDK